MSEFVIVLIGAALLLAVSVFAFYEGMDWMVFRIQRAFDESHAMLQGDVSDVGRDAMGGQPDDTQRDRDVRRSDRPDPAD